MIDITVIPVDGQPHRKTLNGSLEEFQTIIDGYIEVVKVSSYELLLVDEDAVRKNKNVNRIASVLAKKIILGTAILIKIDDFK